MQDGRERVEQGARVGSVAMLAKVARAPGVRIDDLVVD
jgi:hypothetical protein